MRPNIRAIPWLAAMQVTMVVTDHWRRLDPKDRSKAWKIIADSRGLPTKMTPQQRAHLVEIAGRVDRRGLLADLAPIRVPGLRGKRN